MEDTISIIDTDEIRGGTSGASDAVNFQEDDFQEIDPAFLKVAAGDTDEQEPRSQVNTYTKEQVTEAEQTALTILGSAFLVVQDMTGKSLGLTEQKAIKTAKGIAPCLAKYGLTDTAGIFKNWGEEVQAAIAIGGLLFGVWAELKRGNNGNKSEQQLAA